MLARELLLRLAAYLFSSDEIVVHECRTRGGSSISECRNCGTTLQTVTAPCSVCNSTEVTVHQF
jgi:hypothetical protein